MTLEPPTVAHLPRRAGWPEHLHACIAARLGQPFAWGRHDCCLFAADCVAAITGADPAADLRGRYATASSAQRLLVAFGGLAALARRRLGAEISVQAVWPGDVGISLAGLLQTPLLAVWSGTNWLAPAATGLQPVAAPAIAFGVGHGHG